MSEKPTQEDINRRLEELRAFMRWLELYIPFGTTELTEEQLNTIFDEAEKRDFDIWYNKDTQKITVMEREDVM